MKHKCRGRGRFWSALFQKCLSGFHANISRRLANIFHKNEKHHVEDNLPRPQKETNLNNKQRRDAKRRREKRPGHRTAS